MTTMPDPKRLAARSIALCRHLGLDEAAARSMVVRVSSLAEQALLGQGVRDTEWLYQVRFWAAWRPRGTTAPPAGGGELEA